MTDDHFEDLLELEDGFYKEGYDAGVADSEYAGLIEGKVFGIEKGYEKALELGRLHGRAQVWDHRMNVTTLRANHEPESVTQQDDKVITVFNQTSLHETTADLDPLPRNARLHKHIENLLALTDGKTIAVDNSDEAVTEFDDRIAKAKAKAKIISNIVSESLHPIASINSGIEDATGLNARH